MRIRNRHQSGSVLAFSSILAVAALVLIVALGKILFSSSHEMVYLDGMNRAYRMAETGMNDAIGRIINSPRTFADQNGVPTTVDGGVYENEVTRSDSIITSGYYIVTSATHTVGSKIYACRLHTHLRLSNAADYFAAVANELVLSDGIDVSQGRIYSPKITFRNDTAAVTKVKSAEFVTSCDPALDWSVGLKAEILISEPVFPDQVDEVAKANQPTQLDSTILFPEISEADLARYKDIAGPHTVITNFTGQVFPPGYKDGGGGCNTLAGDVYAYHTCENAHHVYYSTDDIRIGDAVVHGQVLFISEKNIYITGNITSAAPAADLPGSPHLSSSTAHQAVLITRNDVLIDDTYYLDSWTDERTQTIEAMVMAPHGQFRPVEYADDDIHSRLSLNYKGALILGALPSTPPGNLASVFQGDAGRVYSYMDSLQENPPPYLPAIVDIYYSIEENTSSAGLY